jgi:5'-nucleotidase
MKILLTNDDGIDAPGLAILGEVLHPDFEIATVAPNEERSAVGHAITFRRDLHAERRSGEPLAFAVNGTPADCVKLAVMALLPWRPDLVLSGINRGINVGHDVLYSGTVAGALEGTMLGLPALAVSLDAFVNPDFRPASRFVRRLLAFLESTPPPPGVVMNVNLPDGDEKKYRGIRWTRQRGVLFRDGYSAKEGTDGRTAYYLDGDVQPTDCLEEGSDCRAVREGYVSITPLSYELTCFEKLNGFDRSLVDLP